MTMKLSGRPARARIRTARLRALPPARPTESGSGEPANEAAARPSQKPRALSLAGAERGVLPDLLHATPAISIDERSLQHALSFAFVAGSAGGALRNALSHSALAASSFTPDTLQDGLFLHELVSIGFAFSLHGRAAPLDHGLLRRLFTQPPIDRSHAEFRQAILRELAAQPALASALKRAYGAIAELPRLLDDEGTDARLDMTHWRLDVLRALRDAIAALDPTFAAASSGLSRLHAYGARVQSSAGYERLCALLDFEGDSARAQLQVRLGADGRIRGLDILALRERADSPFHVSPLRRLWRQVLAWLQGYRIGPNEVVDRWLEEVFEGVREHIPTLLQLKGDLEFYLGALHFKALAESKGLSVCLPEIARDDDAGEKTLHGLWNPLLLSEPRPPIPTDVALPRFACTCITTGPNSGGKTRFLQALALSQLLGQAGAFVPAKQARIRPVGGMFVSLGEAPHAHQKEGRLGMELVRIRTLFEQATAGSFVVLDELCSGTNPSEGEEIFRMLLELLHELEHEVHITTHFLNFAKTLEAESDALGLSFLQVELDPAQHPTYRFVPGVATTSLAQQTAERLGVTRDQLRSMIRRDV